MKVQLSVALTVIIGVCFHWFLCHPQELFAKSPVPLIKGVAFNQTWLLFSQWKYKVWMNWFSRSRIYIKKASSRLRDRSQESQNALDIRTTFDNFFSCNVWLLVGSLWIEYMYKVVGVGYGGGGGGFKAMDMYICLLYTFLSLEKKWKWRQPLGGTKTWYKSKLIYDHFLHDFFNEVYRKNSREIKGNIYNDFGTSLIVTRTVPF